MCRQAFSSRHFVNTSLLAPKRCSSGSHATLGRLLYCLLISVSTTLLYHPDGKVIVCTRDKMRTKNKRTAILDAALEVVEEKGASHLTIDAVAAQTGISKGGLLYHFGSKQALLAGMLEHLIDMNQHRTDQHREANPDGTMLSTMLHSSTSMSPRERRASLALLAASAENSALLDPARDHFDKVFSEVIAASHNQMEAQILLLASEGLRFLDVLSLNPMSQKRMTEITKYMQTKAEGI